MPAPLRSGDLRERVTILKPIYASSTQSGQGVATFSPLADVWAKVEPVDGTENLEAGSITSLVSYKVGIRWYPGIAARMRVLRPLYDGGNTPQTLEIHAVITGSAARDDMTLLCGVVE